MDDNPVYSPLLRNYRGWGFEPGWAGCALACLATELELSSHLRGQETKLQSTRKLQESYSSFTDIANLAGGDDMISMSFAVVTSKQRQKKKLPPSSCGTENETDVFMNWPIFVLLL